MTRYRKIENINGTRFFAKPVRDRTYKVGYQKRTEEFERFRFVTGWRKAIELHAIHKRLFA